MRIFDARLGQTLLRLRGRTPGGPDLLDPRLGQILLLGTLSGFPWIAIGSALSLWLRDLGISRTDVALLGGVGIAYAANLAWAPLLDRLRLPPGLARLGRRKGWILLSQLVVVAGLLAVASVAAPGAGLAGLLGFGALLLCVALAGATADVAIDALRIELIDLSEGRMVGLGASMAVAGWWLSYGGIGGLVLIGVEQLQQVSGASESWRVAYACMALVPVALTALVLLWVREPERRAAPAEATGPSPTDAGEQDAPGTAAGANGQPPAQAGGRGAPDLAAIAAGADRLLREAWAVYRAPIASFYRNYGWQTALGLLAVVVLFKSGEAFLGRMSVVFYDDLGFSKTDIAVYSKFAGTPIIVLASFAGGFVNLRYGLLRGLILSGVAMASTNLLFSLMAVVGPAKLLLATAVVADQITTALSSVTFVAFISQLCDRRHTAAHYAALASLGTLSRTTLASASGWTVDTLLGGGQAQAHETGHWFWFFILTTLMVIPSLALLWGMRARLRAILDPAPDAPAPPAEPPDAPAQVSA